MKKEKYAKRKQEVEQASNTYCTEYNLKKSFWLGVCLAHGCSRPKYRRCISD